MIKSEDDLPWRRRHAWVAAILAISAGGLGYVYSGKYKLAIASMAVLAILPIGIFNIIGGWRFGFLVTIVSAAVLLSANAIYAGLVAAKVGSIQRQRKVSALAYISMLGIMFIFQSVFLSVNEKLWHYKVMRISAGSMMPILKPGDYVVVKRLRGSEKQQDIKLGTIILFENPFHVVDGNPQAYVKRMIGREGDTVEYINGHLVLNSIEVPVVYKSGSDENYYEETMPNGRSYITIDQQLGTSMYDSTPLFKVPKKHYFVLGDNRDNSQDSRSQLVKYVSSENVQAEALYIGFSFNGLDRIGMKLTDK